MQLTQRQQIIAEFIKNAKTASNHEISSFLARKGESISRITLVRDLNALLAHDACPLSFRSVDESEYRNALIIFYEIQNAMPMKRIFLEQFNFAVSNYFL